MVERVLTTFRRNDPKIRKDFGEKVGKIGLGLLRIGFGKTITVGTIPDVNDRYTFREQVYKTAAKVAAMVVFILALPVTGLLAGVGCIGVACSNSHAQLFNSYQNIPYENEAATTIQKYIRGYLARKPLLPLGLYSQYQIQCERVQGRKEHSMPQAIGGKTAVYLPHEMPEVALKRSGRKKAIKRFHKMQEVRAILEAQKSSHLIVPQARLYGDFLVEQRLPISGDYYHNMDLYLSEPELFDEAVREFTRLFSQCSISDLLIKRTHPIASIEGANYAIRYDNLPLYIVEENGKKVGKIGLIDLERAKMKRGFQDVKTLAKIFPLHIEVIRNEALKLNLEMKEEWLASAERKGRKFLQTGFIDHLNWLKQKGRSTESFQISPERANELKSILEQELLKLNQGINDIYVKRKYIPKPPKDFLTENPEEAAKIIVAEIAPHIFENIKELLCEHFDQSMINAKMVSVRSPVLYWQWLFKDLNELISQNQRIKFDQEYNRDRIEEILRKLFCVVLEELVKGNEIFHFNPSHNNSKVCWIRY